LAEPWPKPWRPPATAVERVGVADTFARTAFDPESLMDASAWRWRMLVAAAKRAMARR